MSPLLFCVIWYLSGAFGCALGVKSDLSRGIDFKLSDLIACVFISILGMFALLLGVCELSKNTKYESPTLIKGSK